MDRSIVFALLFIVLSSVAYYFWQEHEANLILSGAKTDIPADSQSKMPATEEETVIHYPVPEQLTVEIERDNEETFPPIVAEAFVLPTLDASDEVMENVFAQLYEPARLVEIFIFSEFIHHIVVSVDNLTAKKLPRRYVFMQRPGGNFIVTKSATENEFELDNKNFYRYRRFIGFGDAISNQQLASIYVRYFPLFQEAYEELGYTGRYFNDRVIEVIDHLMQTPDIIGPVKLLQPKVYYQFADPELEKLSAGQKILIRIGHENAEKIKHRLKDLRRILTTLEP